MVVLNELRKRTYEKVQKDSQLVGGYISKEDYNTVIVEGRYVATDIIRKVFGELAEELRQQKKKKK